MLVLALAAHGLPPLANSWELSSSNSIWTLFTGHLTHWTFDQLFWDALAFGVLGYFCERNGRLRFLGLCLTSSVAVSLAVMWGHSELLPYRGLSGVDSALFGFLACHIAGVSYRRGDHQMAWTAAGGGLLFVGKVVYELASGQTLFVESAGNFTALPISHLAGAMTGIIFWTFTIPQNAETSAETI